MITGSIPRPRTGETSTLETFPDVLQGTDEWTELRRGMVTASTIGRLVTSRSMTATEYPCPECNAPALSPCLSKVKREGEAGAPIKTPHAERTATATRLRKESPRIVEVASGDEVRGLTALLAGERITGYTEPTFVSDDMEAGHENEPFAVDAYSQHYQVPVNSCGFMVRSWGGHKVGYSPDGLVGADGVIEVKTRRQRKHLLTVIADEVPRENMAQIQAALFVSGRAWADYVSFCGGMHLYVKRVLPDERWFAAITEATEAFEAKATSLIAAYSAGIAGMPMTERPALDGIWV